MPGQQGINPDLDRVEEEFPGSDRWSEEEKATLREKIRVLNEAMAENFPKSDPDIESFEQFADEVALDIKHLMAEHDLTFDEAMQVYITAYNEHAFKPEWRLSYPPPTKPSINEEF